MNSALISCSRALQLKTPLQSILGTAELAVDRLSKHTSSPSHTQRTMMGQASAATASERDQAERGAESRDMVANESKELPPAPTRSPSTVSLPELEDSLRTIMSSAEFMRGAFI